MRMDTQFGGACVRSTIGMIVAWSKRRHGRGQRHHAPPRRDNDAEGRREGGRSIRNRSALLAFRFDDDRQVLELVRQRSPLCEILVSTVVRRDELVGSAPRIL
jgi:hypothetical protein